MPAFVAGLQRNSALTTLDLSNNRISDLSGVRLCTVLRTHATLAQITLRDNELKEQTAQLLADITRTRKTLVKVNIDNNPISYKYVVEIRENTHKNLKLQGINRAPGLKKELQELRLLDNNVDEIVEKMQQLKGEEGALMEQIEKQKEKFEHYRVLEEAKTAQILKESEAVQLQKQSVLIELSKVLEEVKVMSSQAAEISGTMETRLWEDRVNAMHSELVRKEKECNSLKKNSIALRSQFTDKIDRMSEELRTQKANKKNLETSLLGLRKQVEIMRFELEQTALTLAGRTSLESDKLRGKVHAVIKSKKKKRAKKEAKETNA